MAKARSALAVSAIDRDEVGHWLSAHGTPQQVSLRGQIILAAADGPSDSAIARALAINRKTVTLWRARYAAGGLESLWEVAPGRGRKPRYGPEKIEQIVEATLQTTPPGMPHWSCRVMAQRHGVSKSTISNIWRSHNLKPHLRETFKLSRDPRFLEKLTDVVGLYLNPPQHALVLCVDEKSQIQALDRTQPGLPLKKGRCGTMTHDYKRHGTTTLFAALDVLQGKVIGQCYARHRHQEFVRFLRRLDHEFPGQTPLHLVLDNYGTHNHPTVKAWLHRHPRFVPHFVPTSASWLNLVERWFGELTSKRIRRDSFQSVDDLIAAIEEFLAVWNENPNPFVWTATVDSIVAKLARCRSDPREDSAALYSSKNNQAAQEKTVQLIRGHYTRGPRTWVLVVLVGMIGVLGASGANAGPVVTPEAAETTPTFSRDVAPILQRSCQHCHQPTGIGPMSLLSYQDVRPWARSIKDRVERRLMPPWHLDTTVGIQDYKNDISLTMAEIETVSRWVDAGAPEGDRTDLPAPLEWPPADAWELEAKLGRAPDFIVRSTPYDVVANGQDQWWDPRVEFEGFSGPRWIRAAEFKPSYPLGIKVTHHGHASLRWEGDPTEGNNDQANPTETRRSVRLVGMGIGKRWDLLPEGVGKLLPAGPAELRFSLHYFPVGEEVTDVVEVGVWLYPEGEEPAQVTAAGEQQFYVDRTHRTRPRASDIIIPPHGYLILEDQYVMESPALIQSFRPHMHMRGTAMSMEALYPDGRRELLSSVNRYNHNWQISYVYDDDAQPLLPRGTVLLLRSKFDNTAANRINPDPDQWVVFGARGVDEMSHAWIGITYLDDSDYDELAAARETMQTTDETDTP